MFEITHLKQLTLHSVQLYEYFPLLLFNPVVAASKYLLTVSNRIDYDNSNQRKTQKQQPLHYLKLAGNI